ERVQWAAALAGRRKRACSGGQHRRQRGQRVGPDRRGAPAQIAAHRIPRRGIGAVCGGRLPRSRGRRRGRRRLIRRLQRIQLRQRRDRRGLIVGGQRARGHHIADRGHLAAQKLQKRRLPGRGVQRQIRIVHRIDDLHLDVVELSLPVGGGGPRGEQTFRQLLLSVAEVGVPRFQLLLQLLDRLGGAAGLLLVGGQRRGTHRCAGRRVTARRRSEIPLLGDRVSVLVE